MASITKCQGGWKCQVRRKGYPSRTKTFKPKVEAVAWSNEVEASMARQMYIPPDSATQSMTVSKLLDKYVKEESRRKASESDDKQRAETIKGALGRYGVTELTPTHLGQYKRDRLAVRSPQTVTHELNLLHRAYVVGVEEWGLVLPRGVPRTSRPQLPPGRDRRVRQEEIDSILANTESEELESIVLLAVETAMRRSEILGLKWERIDLKRRSAYVPKTKTDTPRTVPLSSAAVAVLNVLQRDIGPVFGITSRCASQAFKRAVNRAGLADLHFHDLRHEATSRLFERGLNVLEVARITGHKSLVMLNRYLPVLLIGSASEKVPPDSLQHGDKVPNQLGVGGSPDNYATLR